MKTSSRMVGPVRVRPQIKNGTETGKWFVDVPASLTSNGRRKRKLFDNQKTAMAAAKALRHRIDPVTGVVAVKPDRSSLNIEEAVALWAEDEKQRVLTLKKKPATLKIELYKLKPVPAFSPSEYRRPLAIKTLLLIRQVVLLLEKRLRRLTPNSAP